MKLNKKNRQIFDFVIFVGPLLFLYCMFFLGPLVQGVGYSFTSWNGLSPNIEFVMFDNYIKAFSDTRFHDSIVFSFVYTFFYVISINVLGLLAALAMNRSMRTQNTLRALLFAPYVLNIVTIGFIWQFIFGRLFIGLAEATGFAIFEVSMLGDSNNVMLSFIIVKIWQSLGYFMVIYLAGLQAIPLDVLEAAKVEGANAWYTFWKVKLPLIVPALTVCVFTALVNGLRIFELVMTLTNGGPGRASESMALNIYKEAYEKSNFGYASAKSVILLVIIVIFTIIQLNFFKKREVEA